MAANAITLFRLFLTFIVIGLFQQLDVYIDIACIVTILIIFILDSVDGIVARKQNQTSTFGAVFDIAADRIVENVFWIYFAVIDGRISFWLPIAVVTRGFLTDGVRSIALTEGKTAFEMSYAAWSRALISSRFSRGLYGLTKMLTFIFLPATLVLNDIYPVVQNDVTISWVSVFSSVSVIIAYVTVAMCIIRGIPVLVDGWRYIKPEPE